MRHTRLMKTFRMVFSLVAATVTALVSTAIPAMAQYPPPRPADTQVVRGPEVASSGADAVESTVAFTGSDMTILMVAIALLIVTGIVAIRLGRQRAAKATA
jgi:hypothetical protein